VLVEPLHPQAFHIVWSLEVDRLASQILPGGTFVPYLLLPTALSGSKEWAAHLNQIAFLLLAIFVTALAALRLGLGRRQARYVALLTAACPAVLGMAGTVMPDVEAMLLVILGMERMMAWREDRKWHQAVAATCWLTLAALTRIHTIVILAAAFVLLLDGITREEIRASFRHFPVRFVPIVVTPAAYLLVSAIAAAHDAEGDNLITAVLGSPGNWTFLFQNGFAFLAHWTLVIPLTIPWLALRYRQIPTALASSALLGASLLSLRLGWVAFAVGASCVVLVDIAWDAIRRRDRVQLALWLWLFLATPVVIYIHLPSKYLLPSVPAAAVLLMRLIPEASRSSARWLIPATVAAGVILGFLVLLGVRDLAETQRRAVAEFIEPRVKLGEHIWFSGHWGFQWYAEQAGATPTTMESPFPQAGETIVVSEIDAPYFARWWTHRRVMQHSCYASSPIGRVMDKNGHAGFFSNPYGYLPWVWGRGEPSCFEVWQVE
jgi:hypothetical protein